jgi:O-antigen ligase
MFARRTGDWKADAGLASIVPSLPLALCALVTVGSLVLGGGTRSGFLSDAILQLLSIPPLLTSLWQLLGARASKGSANSSLRWGLAFCAALIAIPLVQIIPLPPVIWTRLPNRHSVVEAFELVGGDLPWMPISVTPEATSLSALSLMPPIAVFLSTVLLSYAERRLMSLLILGIGLISAFLGLLQVAQGPSSPLRFFAFTNTSEAVGFFANRNHFAALVNALILLAACWASHAVFRARASLNFKVHDMTAVAGVVASVAVILVFLSAEAMARSRAGLALTILALIGAFALAWKEWRMVSRGAAKLLVGLIVSISLFVAEFTLYRIMERFATDPLADSRIPFARNTFTAAMDYMPFGSGVGSFVPVYAIYERPSDTMMNAFANHAHNDVLEICLEAGVFGVILIGFFAAWVTRRSVEVWGSSIFGARDIDLWLARSASIIVILLAIHSLVDYPLRTAALMALIAFACGLLVAPFAEADKASSLRREGRGEHSVEKPRRRPPVRGAAPLAGSMWAGESQKNPTGEAWGKDVTWPEAWRKGPQS